MNRLLAFILLSLVMGMACNEAPAPIVTASGTIRAGQFSVFYERTGNGNGAPLVLLHAGIQDHSMWEEQVKALSAQYEVITPDLPYHGKTTGVDTTLLASDVIRILLDSLQVQRASIGGLSLGAVVAQDFVIAYPDRVNKVLLISPGLNGYNKIHPIDSVSAVWYDLFTKALVKKDTARAAWEFTKAWAAGGNFDRDSLRAPVSQYVYRTTLANLRQHQAKRWPRLQEQPPAVERLASIQKPVLVIDGDQDLPYILACSAYLVQQIPGAKRTTIPGVAHMLNMEKPAVFNDLLLSFLGTAKK